MYQRAAQLISQLGTKNDQAARDELLEMFPNGIGPGGSHGEPPPGTTIEEREDGHYLILNPTLGNSWGGPVAAPLVYHQQNRINTRHNNTEVVSKPSIFRPFFNIALNALLQTVVALIAVTGLTILVMWIHGHSKSEMVDVFKSLF